MKKYTDSSEMIKYLNVSPYNKIDVHSPFLACVGINGQYSQDTICNGFNQAVNVLIKSIVSNNNIMADSIVYPILFCVRHTIELYLKDIYNFVKFISDMKTYPNEFIELKKI